MRWNQNVPLIEFNVEFHQVRRNAQYDENEKTKYILIDFYLNTLPKDLATTVQDHLDQYIALDSDQVTLDNAMKLAVQKSESRGNIHKKNIVNMLAEDLAKLKG